MSSILFSLPEFFENYKRWVSSNPLVASDFETSTKWISYFIAGRVNNSQVLTELIYCLSNLLVFFNDQIINNVKKLKLPKSGDVMKIWMTVLEYSEVFLELSAKKLWGNSGKWIIIVAIQSFKCVSRLLLLFYHKDNVIQNPPIPALQRKNVLVSNEQLEAVPSCSDQPVSQVSFTLKRSGRVIRKVDASPPVALRTWQPLVPVNDSADDVPLSKSLLIAETMYAVKPLLHLGAMKLYGRKQWKPYMFAFVLDMSSLYLYHKYRKMSKIPLSYQQRLELSRRSFALLLYLLRSPFYDRHSKDRIQAMLKSIADTVPLARMICNPLAQYLPHWQDTYFYMWST